MSKDIFSDLKGTTTEQMRQKSIEMERLKRCTIYLVLSTFSSKNVASILFVFSYQILYR